MYFLLIISLITAGMMAAMMAFLETGRRIGARRIALDPEGARAGVTALEAGVFGLLGLMIAFTFSGAMSRFDSRRHLVVEETNDIGTAYLRVDLLPPAARPPVRELFRRYLDSRLETYRRVPDMAAVKEEMARSAELQGEIWRQSVAASRLPDAHPDAARLLLPALNAMFDITTTRTMAARIHPPLIVFVLLLGLAMAGSLLAGHGMAEGKKRTWLHMLCFSVAMAAAIYVILDIEYPRMGLIRVDAIDQAMVDLRNSMK